MINIGEKIGCFEIIGRDLTTKQLICKCECGNIVYKYGNHIKERCKSCGDNTKHNSLFLEKISKINKDISNQKKYGTLIIIKYLGYYNKNSTENKKHRVLCQCECGNNIEYDYNILINSINPTCKKLNNYHDKLKNTLVNQKYFMRWKSMHDRCYVKHRHNYEWYGGKGIEVCDEWRYYPGEIEKRKLSFQNYKNYEKWLDNEIVKNNLTYELFLSLKYSIDRIDNNGPYAPWNCQLLNQQEQTDKQSTIRNIFYKDQIFRPMKLVNIIPNVTWKYLYAECKDVEYDTNALFKKHPIWKFFLDFFINITNDLSPFVKKNYNFIKDSKGKYNYNYLIHNKYLYKVKNQNQIIKSSNNREYIIPEKIRYR